jgi:hypothetical protein
MKRTLPVTTLFLDNEAVLLTDSWIIMPVNMWQGVMHETK